MIVKYLYCYGQYFMPKYFFFRILKRRNIYWEFGENIRWGVFSIYVFSPKSSITIGDNVVFSNALLNVTIAKKCKIFVSKEAVLKIGNNSGFSGLSLFCSKGISIGNNVVCGGNVSIWDTDFHQLNSVDRVQNSGTVFSKAIKIGDDVFIGANCIILKGSTIGNRSILGAGSVLRGEIGDDELWIGNPAIFIKKLENNG